MEDIGTCKWSCRLCEEELILKIRSEKGLLGMYCGAVLFLTVFFCWVIADMCKMNDVLSAAVIGVIGATLICICILEMIAFCRTLEMSQDGCTISFLVFRRSYKWKNFAIKRVEDYGKCRISDRVYNEGIFFSLYPWKKPKWVSAGYYMIRHPWSCFAIHFKSNKRIYVRGHADTYEVDRRFFIERMKEWGIEIEKLTK